MPTRNSAPAEGGCRFSRLCRLAIGLAAAQLAAACASVPDAPRGRTDALAESFYVVAPWAQQAPVDITARLGAVNAALAGLRSSIDGYYAGLRAQADAHNSRVFLQSELAAAREAQRGRELAARPAQTGADSDWRQSKPAGIDPRSVAPYQDPSTMQDLGVAVAEWVKSGRGWISGQFRRVR